MSKISNLRQADELVELAMVAFTENDIPADKINEHKVRKVVLQLLEDNPQIFHYVEIIDDEIVAFSMGHLKEGAFDNRLYAVLATGYVKPKHRGFTIVDTMREEFEKWAKEHGADIISVAFPTSMQKPMRARGYEAQESLYVKDISVKEVA